MISYPNYPAVSDVEVMLRSATYWPTNAAQIAYAQEQARTTIDAAVAEFETRTGWTPFLAAQAIETETFDGTDHTGYLDLEGGMAEITGVSLNEQSYVLGTQWWPQPQNARRRKKPYTGIQLNVNTGFGMAAFGLGRPGRISVSGRFGYCEEVPADAWLAMMRLAAAQTLGQIENAQGVASISQDGFSKAFDVVGVITQKDLLGELSKRFDKIASSYVRVVV